MPPALLREMPVCAPLDRVAAFAAIRRAAEVAREYDREASKSSSIDVWGDALTTTEYYDWAYAVRYAIRTAIGSERV